jgi:hypothetical protein
MTSVERALADALINKLTMGICYSPNLHKLILDFDLTLTVSNFGNYKNKLFLTQILPFQFN